MRDETERLMLRREDGRVRRALALLDDIEKLHAAIEDDDPDAFDMSAADTCASLYSIMGRHGMPVR